MFIVIFLVYVYSYFLVLYLLLFPVFFIKTAERPTEGFPDNPYQSPI